MSMSKTFNLTMMNLGPAAVVAAVAVLAGGCATPCVDDGLNQSFCPVAGGAGTAGEATATDYGPGPDATGEGGSATSGTDTDGTGPGQDGSNPNACPVLDVSLTPQIPMVVILLDQSASMNEDFGGVSRWDAVGDTLFDATDGLVGALQSKIRFGLTLYTSIVGDGGQCPFLQEASVAIDNLETMRQLYDEEEPLGETPTGESLDLVVDLLAQDPDPAKKFIILATDGEPDTCAMPNPQNGQPEAIAAAEKAFAAGIKTFVISVGSDVSDGHLQDMANAGAGAMSGDPDAPFYKALDQQELVQAFDEIVAEVRDCRLVLSEPLYPDQATGCAVAIDDKIVHNGSDDGWRLVSPDRIELLGAACESIQLEEVSVRMFCDCGAIRK